MFIRFREIFTNAITKMGLPICIRWEKDPETTDYSRNPEPCAHSPDEALNFRYLDHGRSRPVFDPQKYIILF